MQRNYYDILEINKNASPEIVEKAYKTLVKKYHPDLQDDISKKTAEAKMKELNEAYDVLSSPEKRELYNKELEQLEKEVQAKTQSQFNGYEVYQQKLVKKEKEKELNEEKEIEYARQQVIRQTQYEQEMQNAINKAYYDAYIQDLKKRGYKIKYRKSLKDYIKGIISIVLTIFILFLIFQIPFIKNFFYNLYQENEFLHILVDIFK